MNVEPKYHDNLSTIAVPGYIYDQLRLYGMNTGGLAPVYIRRPKDQINPANLNYPWKGHPVD